MGDWNPESEGYCYGTDRAEWPYVGENWNAALGVAESIAIAPTIRVGTVVQFAQPEGAQEAAQRFTVVELRGPRVLVQTLDPYWAGPIVPQSAYMLTDLTVAA